MTTDHNREVEGELECKRFYKWDWPWLPWDDEASAMRKILAYQLERCRNRFYRGTRK